MANTHINRLPDAQIADEMYTENVKSVSSP